MPDLSSWCSFGRKFQGTIPRQLPGKCVSLRPFSAITLSRRQYCTAYSYTTKLPFLSLADKVYCQLESELKQAEEAVWRQRHSTISRELWSARTWSTRWGFMPAISRTWFVVSPRALRPC